MSTQTEIKIDKNIPIQHYTKQVKGYDKYPFMEMEVGDSFAIPEGHNDRSIKTYASTIGKKMGIKFKIYKTPDGTYRCWRVS